MCRTKLVLLVFKHVSGVFINYVNLVCIDLFVLFTLQEGGSVALKWKTFGSRELSQMNKVIFSQAKERLIPVQILKVRQEWFHRLSWILRYKTGQSFRFVSFLQQYMICFCLGWKCQQGKKKVKQNKIKGDKSIKIKMLNATYVKTNQDGR